MSDHVLLNSLMSLGKAIACDACRILYRPFRYEFNNFNDTGAQIAYSIYHTALL